MQWTKKDLLDIETLEKEEIELILETASNFKEILARPIKKVPTLRGKTIANLFFEPSTRTRTSFELAGKRLSADMINIAVATSSVTKGEILKDTALNIEAMGVDIVVIRHSVSGSAYFLSKILKASVINAGDGMHEHPTQGLLDIYTIKEKKGEIKDLKVAIIGDIVHSRVARSNIWGLKKLGAEVIVAGPPTLIPPYIEKLGVKVYYNIEEAVHNADVVNVLRLQLERQHKGLFPSIKEYANIFGVNSAKLKYAKKDVLLLHPGPMNRDIEISDEVTNDKRFLALEQVLNGVAVRMAVLYLISGSNNENNN